MLFANLRSGLNMGLATHFRRVQRVLLLPFTATMRNLLLSGQPCPSQHEGAKDDDVHANNLSAHLSGRSSEDFCLAHRCTRSASACSVLNRVLTVSWKKPYALVPTGRMRIECESGIAWVTVDGDLNDHVLVPKQAFCVVHGDRALIVGMPTCRVRLVSQS